VDEFLEAQASLSGPGMTGWWVRVLDELPEDKRESLLAAGKNPAITHRAISVVLARWGYEVRPLQVGHWRRNHLGRYGARAV
jgi:hypothetical protein